MASPSTYIRFRHLKCSSCSYSKANIPRLILAPFSNQRTVCSSSSLGIKMEPEKAKIIGGLKDFRVYSKTDGFNLTHPPMPRASCISPRILLQTTKKRAVIDPAKTALVIADLRNCFLSPSIGCPSNSVGVELIDRLSKQAMPACRKTNVPMV